nr:MAG TPA_asm: hypothetical protein [Caudoviricetes sp.]
MRLCPFRPLSASDNADFPQSFRQIAKKLLNLKSEIRA